MFYRKCSQSSLVNILSINVYFNITIVSMFRCPKLFQCSSDEHEVVPQAKNESEWCEGEALNHSLFRHFHWSTSHTTKFPRNFTYASKRLFPWILNHLTKVEQINFRFYMSVLFLIQKAFAVYERCDLSTWTWIVWVAFTALTNARWPLHQIKVSIREWEKHSLTLSNWLSWF